VSNNSTRKRITVAALGAGVICAVAAMAVPAAAQATADLRVSQGDFPDPARNGHPLGYAIQVSNAGPDRARGVTVIDTLSPRVNFLSANSPRPSVNCHRKNRRVKCSVGRLDANQSTSINIVVTPALAREHYTVLNTVSVRRRADDPDGSNNTARERTTVENPPPVNCAGRQASIVGTNGGDTLVGTEGADVIAALSGNDNVIALGGNDIVCGSGGRDIVRGAAGSDRIKTGGGGDRLHGGDGNDRLQGKAGRDKLSGGRGKDRLKGGRGKDRCRGGAGKDSKRSC
jgi:uncharacterized repeat protein (TIGR01451 family)